MNIMLKFKMSVNYTLDDTDSEGWTDLEFD